MHRAEEKLTPSSPTRLIRPERGHGELAAVEKELGLDEI
jgi:hypothetical protein